MHLSSTPVYWVIFKSTFQPLRSLHFFPKAWSMLFLTSFCFLNLVSSPFHTHLSQSQHPLFTASGQRSFFIHIFSPLFPLPCSFLPSLSFFLFGLSIYELWAFFKLSLLMFLGVSLSFHVCRPLHPLYGQQMENQCVCSTVSLLESNMLREGLSLSLSALLHFSSLISV